MKTRLLKEARQLLPVWVAALLLATMPVSLWPGLAGFPIALCLVLGLVVLAVACFGREFSQRTFAMFAVQPISRERLWWEKVAVLAAATTCVAWMFVAVCKVSTFGSVEREFPASTFALYAGLAAFGGGLCMTLALRQILASICFTLLFPIGLMMTVSVLAQRWLPEWERALNQIALIVYSIVTFLLARRLFLRAQDVQWTGGTLALPSLGRWIPNRSTASGHPLTALVRKEFQLQQVSFLLGGILLLMQITVLLLPKLVTVSESSALAIMVNGFWILWLVMPLLVGCSSVAEERRLGTLESQLCLPVSRGKQFVVKMVVTLASGVLLGALVPLAVALDKSKRGMSVAELSTEWIPVCALVTLVSLYASTLTRHLLQAFSTAIVLLFLVFLIPNWLMGAFSRGPQHLVLFGYELWQGPLIIIVGAGVALAFLMFYTWSKLRWFWMGFLVVVLFALYFGTLKWALDRAFTSDSHLNGLRFNTVTWFTLALWPVLLMSIIASQNFKHLQTSISLWLRNSMTWGCWLFASILVTMLIYHRVWERAMPFEPPAGPPLLSGSARPTIAVTSSLERIFALLPDGRIWSHRDYELVPTSTMNEDTNQTAPERNRFKSIKRPHSEFVGGSNWIAFASLFCEFVAIRSDGSLWNAYWWESVDRDGNIEPVHVYNYGRPGWKRIPGDMKIIRIGTDSDWVNVASGYGHFIALKGDGTIWGWGSNHEKQLGDGPEAFTNAPTRMGNDSDWLEVFAERMVSFALKRDGSIWKWGDNTRNGPIKLNINVPGVRNICSYSDLDLILDNHGDLWGLGRIPSGVLGRERGFERHVNAQRLGGQNDLAAVCMDWEGVVGLKSGGSLWDMRSHGYYGLHGSPASPPSQLGRRNDWIAVEMYSHEALLALAKDGTLCRFGELYQYPGLLAPTRRVTWSINVLDAEK